MRHDNIDSVEIGDVSPPTELNSYDCTFFYKYFVPIGTKFSRSVLINNMGNKSVDEYLNFSYQVIKKQLKGDLFMTHHV